MKEENIKNFLNELYSKRIDKQFHDGHRYKADLINKEDRSIFEGMLRTFLNEFHDETKGILEAKIYAYEKMIANSNFAPIIKEIKDEK